MKISDQGLYKARPQCPYCSSNQDIGFQSNNKLGIHWVCENNFSHHTRTDHEFVGPRWFNTPAQSHFIHCPFCFGSGVIYAHIRKGIYSTCPDCRGRKWLRA